MRDSLPNSFLRSLPVPVPVPPSIRLGPSPCVCGEKVPARALGAWSWAPSAAEMLFGGTDLNLRRAWGCGRCIRVRRNRLGSVLRKWENNPARHTWGDTCQSCPHRRPAAAEHCRPAPSAALRQAAAIWGRPTGRKAPRPLPSRTPGPPPFPPPPHFPRGATGPCVYEATGTGTGTLRTDDGPL